MKNSILAIALGLVTMSGTPAEAFSDVALTAGAFTTEVSPETSGISSSSGTGFFAGVLGFMKMQEPLWLRAGAIVGRRNLELSTSTLNIEYEVTMIEAPVTAMYMLNEMVGFFGGLRFGINAGDDCSSNLSTACSSSNTDFESFIYAAEVGGHFRFTPNFGGEVAYDIGLSDFAKDTKWDGGLVINAFMIF